MPGQALKLNFFYFSIIFRRFHDNFLAFFHKEKKSHTDLIKINGIPLGFDFIIVKKNQTQIPPLESEV